MAEEYKKYKKYPHYVGWTERNGELIVYICEE